MSGTAPAGATWSRLHPLSPLLRSGRFVLAAVALVGQQGLREASGRALLLGAAVVVPVGLLVGLVTWLTTRYRVTDTELQVESGLLQRRSRRVPLARLQSVDVVRSLAARVLGLSELRLEVAGGSRTEAPLAHLSEDDALRLRARLLAAAAVAPTPASTPARAPARGPGADLAAGPGSGAGPGPGSGPGGHASRGDGPLVTADGAAPSDPYELGPPNPLAAPAAAREDAGESVLVRVPTGALVLSTLLTLPALLTVLLAVAVLALLVVAPAAAAGVFAALLPTALGTGGFVVRRVLGEYGFTVAEAPGGLRLRHGLLDTRSQSIPEGRVQAVRVSEPLLWRWRGWVRVEVDVAGYGRQRGGREELGTTSALLPVAPRALAHDLVARVLGAPLPPATSQVPGRAAWRAPLSARRLAVGLDGRHVVAKSGVLTTRTDVVPLAKVQGLRLVQGPWQRRLRLASVHVDSAGRVLRGAVARHRDAGDAHLLLATLTAQAREARRRPAGARA